MQTEVSETSSATGGIHDAAGGVSGGSNTNSGASSQAVGADSSVAVYGWKVEPNCAPTFPEGDDVYFGDGPVPALPQRPPWPPSPSLPGIAERLASDYSGRDLVAKFCEHDEAEECDV